MSTRSTHDRHDQLSLESRPGNDTPPAPEPATVENSAQLLQFPARVDAALVERCGRDWSALAGTGRVLIADTSRVTFIDSTGVGALLRLARTARAHGAKLLIAALSGTVHRVLEMMKLTSVFTFTPDVASAQAHAEHRYDPQSLTR